MPNILCRSNRDLAGLSPADLLDDPCLPLGMRENVTATFDVSGSEEVSDEHKAALGSPGQAVRLFLRGTGEWRGCYSSLTHFVHDREKFSACSSPSSCPDAGISAPAIQFDNSEFYAFSEFWYSMEDVLKMGGPYMQKKFQQAASVSVT